MNIFALHGNPAIAARLHCNQHVPKMVLETAQLLCTAHHLLSVDSRDVPYSPTHINHPCAVWVRESSDNYLWTYQLFRNLAEVYTGRYNKDHKTFSDCYECVSELPELIAHGKLTEWPQCMPDEYKHDDPIEAYRRYYMQHKYPKFNGMAWGRTGSIPPVLKLYMGD